MFEELTWGFGLIVFLVVVSPPVTHALALAAWKLYVRFSDLSAFSDS